MSFDGFSSVSLRGFFGFQVIIYEVLMSLKEAISKFLCLCRIALIDVIMSWKYAVVRLCKAALLS